jgi:hypothetical protein
VTVRPLLPQQKATQGDYPSPELVQVLQQIMRKLEELERRVKVLEP